MSNCVFSMSAVRIGGGQLLSLLLSAVVLTASVTGQKSCPWNQNGLQPCSSVSTWDDGVVPTENAEVRD